MEKQRIDFDQWFEEQCLKIKTMPIALVKKEREKLKAVLDGLHILLRDEDLKEGKKKYLKGKRKFTTQLLAYTKERIKLFNTVAHNGVSQNLALKFVQIASVELSQRTFQKLYALATMEAEEKVSSIKEIQGFVKEFKEISGNGK